MSNPDYRYPLHWPIYRERTPFWRRKSSAYKVTAAAARDALWRELARIGAWRIQVSCNVPLLRNGLSAYHNFCNLC